MHSPAIFHNSHNEKLVLDPTLLLFGASLFALTWASDIVLVKGFNIPILLAVLACASIFVGFQSLRLNTRSKTHIVGLFILVMWALASNLWSEKPDMAVSFSYYYALTLVFFFLTLLKSDNHRRWAFLGMCYLAGCLVCALMVILTWSHNPETLHYRYTVNTINANYIAYSLATAVPILVAMVVVLNMRSKMALCWVYVALAAFLSAIFLSGCRSALVAFCLGLPFLGYVTWRRSRLFAMMLLVFFALAMFLMFESFPAYLQVRFASLFELAEQSQSVDFSGRLVAWPEALRMFWQHPLFGIGAGAFQSSEMGVRAHNVFLSVLVELGAVGLFLYLFTIGSVMRAFLYERIPAEFRMAGYTLLIVWLAIALAGVWEVSQVAWFAFAWFASMPGLEQQHV